MLNMGGESNIQPKCFTIESIKRSLHSSSQENRYNLLRAAVTGSVFACWEAFPRMACSICGQTLGAEGPIAEAVSRQPPAHGLWPSSMEHMPSGLDSAW